MKEESNEKKYEKAALSIQEFRKECAKGFIAKDDVLELAVSAFFSGLHILIEDVSGVGKTTLIRCIAKASGLPLSRIQFTPDLLPGDITGMMIWEPVKKEFIFRPGPLCHPFVLADELNRAPARTQSALLEAMQDKSITVDGESRELSELFFVAATQNPSWYAGTYKLPESQLDRFGISMAIGYPDFDSETSIISEFKNKDPLDQILPCISEEEILEIRNLILNVQIKKNVLDYAVNLARKTRIVRYYQSGISIRGIQHLIRAAQANALGQGRDFVIPEDLTKMAFPVMRHRLELSPEARSSGLDMDSGIEKILSEVKIPVL